MIREAGHWKTRTHEQGEGPEILGRDMGDLQRDGGKVKKPFERMMVVVSAYRDGSFMRKSRRRVPRLDVGPDDDLDGVGVFFLEYVHHRVDHTSHFCAS